MPELAQVFQRHGPRYLKHFGKRMLPGHRRALEDISRCRTEPLGGHVFECDHCGSRHYAYHSCKNRSCPKCCGADTSRWLEKRRGQLLPVTYFHLVFTLPAGLRELVRAHQKVLLGVLMRAAASSLLTLARDPRYVGGTIGILCVLHTWTRAMVYHPHVHCLVPAGALAPDTASWNHARRGFLVPVQALSEIFRARFLAMARKALPGLAFPDTLFERRWVVYAKPAVQGADKVLRYLARYVHRIAIVNSRIVGVTRETVTFRYKDSRNRCWKTMTLAALEFMRRFLQHVLPRGFHKVRGYGLLAPANRSLLFKAQQLLVQELADPDKTGASPCSDCPKPAQPEPRICPDCSIGHLILIARLLPQKRAPPCQA